MFMCRTKKNTSLENVDSTWTPTTVPMFVNQAFQGTQYMEENDVYGESSFVVKRNNDECEITKQDATVDLRFSSQRGDDRLPVEQNDIYNDPRFVESQATVDV
eukprot:m.77948 g.77948  ORF g.77948 m.77948 type:complete len:103 (+) comp8557_c0_seq1:530-838(+)